MYIDLNFGRDYVYIDLNLFLVLLLLSTLLILLVLLEVSAKLSLHLLVEGIHDFLRVAVDPGNSLSVHVRAGSERFERILLGNGAPNKIQDIRHNTEVDHVGNACEKFSKLNGLVSLPYDITIEC